MSGFFTKTHEDFPDTPEEQEVHMFPGQVMSVSFSGLTTFEQCPYAIYLDKIGKVGRAAHKAADRGSSLHDMLEQYVLGTIDTVKWTLLKSFDFHKGLIETFREAYLVDNCIPELKLAFTLDMVVTDWEADDMWLRGAIDVVIWNDDHTEATLYDYKSGSNQAAAKHRSQLMLYAMMMFIAYPKLKALRVAPIYLDHKIENFYTNYLRDDLDTFWPRYYDRLKRVTDCRQFIPNPNGFTCRYCQHKKTQESLSQTEPACAFAYIG